MVFYNSCNIMDELYRGWGGCWGVGGKPKAGNTIHKETNSSAVSSVGHRNCHGQPGRPQTVVSSSLTPQTALLVPITGPIDPVVGPSWFYRVGKRPPVKADLAIYSLAVGMSGLWGECSYNVKQ